MKHIVKAKEAD